MKYKILAMVWFFMFWGMMILEQGILGKYPTSKSSTLVLFLWFFPAILLATTKD